MTDWDKVKYPTSYISQVFGDGLIVIRVGDPETGTKITSIKDSQDGYNNHASPQMMLLPVTFQWPQERQTIDEVYTKFGDWVGDTNKTEWYKTYGSNKVTKRSTK